MTSNQIAGDHIARAQNKQHFWVQDKPTQIAELFCCLAPQTCARARRFADVFLVSATGIFNCFTFPKFQSCDCCWHFVQNIGGHRRLSYNTIRVAFEWGAWETSNAAHICEQRCGQQPSNSRNENTSARRAPLNENNAHTLQHHRFYPRHAQLYRERAHHLKIPKATVQKCLICEQIPDPHQYHMGLPLRHRQQ